MLPELKRTKRLPRPPAGHDPTDMGTSVAASPDFPGSHAAACWINGTPHPEQLAAPSRVSPRSSTGEEADVKCPPKSSRNGDGDALSAHPPAISDVHRSTANAPNTYAVDAKAFIGRWTVAAIYVMSNTKGIPAIWDPQAAASSQEFGHKRSLNRCPGTSP